MNKVLEKCLVEVEKYSAHNYKPLPVVLTHGKGVWVKDVTGKKYLDCLSSYSALNQGHRHPKIIKALKTQADKITVTSRAFHNDQMGPFLKKLCQACDMEMALPMNTGTEAVETAIKSARKWGYRVKKVPENRAEIIVCQNNFHGRTVTIVSFSTEAQYRQDFGPFTPGFVSVPYGDIDALKKAINPNTVGFIFEPIQGEGGVVIPREGYWTEAQKVCRENKVLFIADEIQTGLGRTGKLFCYQHEKEVKPDMLIVGKALGGGVYPVSAVVASKEILGLYRPGDHGSTFGGNPLGAAVAIASLDVILKEKLSQRSEKMGKYFLDKLKKIKSPHIKEVRGKGLMIGIEIKTSSGTARPFCEKLADLGVLAKDTHDQVIRFMPPLVISKKEIDWALQRIAKVLK
jgi:ornithine--oxo-acid transaminase